MKLGCQRPNIDEVGFELYDRAIHPEFFDILNRREFAVHAYQMRVIAALTRDGHVIEYRHPKFRVVEVLGSFADERPVAGLNRKVKIRHHHQFDNSIADQALCRFGLQREVLELSVFERMQEEIAADARKSKLKALFPTNTPLDSTAVSYVTVNTLPGAIAVQTFHTFPEDLGILKTQTLIEFDPSNFWT
jgi:hypothetical protein